MLSIDAKSARKEFRTKYGKQTYQVVSYILKGWNSNRIANKFELTTRTVATIKANVTRGTYAPYAIYGGGTCHFS